MDVLRSGSLVAATVGIGLMAGVFGLYAHTIMRGLHGTDDRTFVGAFGAIDRAIINPIFIPTFLGSLILAAIAAATHLGDDWRNVLPWVVVALVLYLVTVIITFAVHLPLNDELKAAGELDQISDVSAVRERFHETRWMAWNIVRTVTSTAAFISLCWALVLHGRA